MQAAFYLIDLLHDGHSEVVKAADRALTVISETDEEWATKLRALKFEAHNQIWLEACASGVAQVRQWVIGPCGHVHACRLQNFVSCLHLICQACTASNQCCMLLLPSTAAHVVDCRL